MSTDESPFSREKNYDSQFGSNHVSFEMGAGGRDTEFHPIKRESRDGDGPAYVGATSAAVILVAVAWLTVWLNEPSSFGWFALHAPLQSLGIGMFTLGVLSLQQTAQPKSKAVGLEKHQLYIFYIGVPSIVLGTWAVYYNKYLNGYPHFMSWHGTIGIWTVLLMSLQVLVGGGSVWSGGVAFGGGSRAKSIYKYHRASGYVVLPLFLLTLYLGGSWSKFSITNAVYPARFIAYNLAPLVIMGSLYSRIRFSKMRFQ